MNALRIGIDASELYGEPAGVGRYLAELIRQWVIAGLGARHRFVLYAPATPGPTSTAFLDLSKAEAAVEVRHVPGRAGTAWQQLALRRALIRDRPDVFFAPAYTAPLGLPLPVVLALHDVSFAAHPEWFGQRHGMRLRWLATLAGRSATAVVTLSAFSRQQIVEHLGLPASRIVVAAPGVGDGFRREPSRDQRAPLVLFVGSLFNRRHLPDLVVAFDRLARRDPEARLVIVGRNRTDPFEDPAEMARRLGIDRQVEVTSYVPDATLRDLYGRARAFAFLSSYEGFAMTPLEAIAAGVPPVLLDTPVAREVYRDAALYVGCGDVDATADALRRLLYADEPAATLLARGAAIIEAHSWARTARQILEILEQACR